MTTLKSPDTEAISDLVGQYDRLSEPDRRRYSETETRTNFIDRLFLALGWPVYDRAHVERETTVAEGKRPDYIFKLHGVPRLFLEAKPLRDDVYNLEYARDAITKAYNKGVAWAGVTNFANLVIFDAQEELRPPAPPGRVLDLSCGDYLRPDAGLYFLTPHVLDQHLLDEHAQRTGVRRRAVPIEKRLYESMRQWRELLFNHMRAALDWKTDAQLRTGDEAIQRLIDRLIFLRNCEDRGIGKTDLRALLHRIRSRPRSVRVTESLLRIFAEAAAIYDSELFHADALVDVLLLGLATRTDVDDTLGEIIEGLYSVPRSYAEYDFAQMDADVLGQVYEQYLGYVPQHVRQLAAQQPLPGQPAREITVEAKRERRKQRGIYYTPKWVVDYIVRQTVGRFLEEHRDDPEAIANLTILDPACGSGSFLIRAYETLLEHHARQMGGDVGHLDRKMREWVLRHNIFGVDLDPQAVEIARLNLLIRMVREEEELPSLADNIRLGNSLISGDEKDMRSYFGRLWREKQRFDWQREFPDIMTRGGFDVVIGNPPYVETSLIPVEERDYYREQYKTAHGGFDLYVLFMERALELLREGGWLSLITSGKFLKADYGKRLCDLIESTSAPTDLVDLSCRKEVFARATNYPVIIVCRKINRHQPLRYTLVPEHAAIEIVDALNEVIGQLGYNAPAGSLTHGLWPPLRQMAQTGELLFEKLSAIPSRLGDTNVAHIFHGLQTNADRVFVVQRIADHDQGFTRVRSPATGRERDLEAALLHPLLKGSVHMRRWRPSETNLLLLFPYPGGSSTLIPPEVMADSYPATWEYLNLPECKGILEGREVRVVDGQESYRWRGHPEWYGYGRLVNHGRFGVTRPRLLTPSLAQRASFSYDPDGRCYFLGSGGGGGGGYGIELNPGLCCSPLFVLGLLNSVLSDWFLRRISSPFRGGYWAYNRQYISGLPMHLPDMDTAKDKRLHDDLVMLVERMLDLHQRLAAKAKVHDEERAQIEREIARTNREIDDLVYDLYGLTAAERDLVEREMAR
jgi:methylase of polypeptide subunit release factors